jgi:hypothetical protein
VEAAEVEGAYGAERTVHVSLEEFARTLTARKETEERLREGGVGAKELAARRARAEADGEVERFRRAYRTFRAFDRPNVLSIYATFRYDRRFAAEYPEAVQTGPLWPTPPFRGGPAAGGAEWVWYASPASSEAIAAEVVGGLRRVGGSPTLFVRAPRPWTRIDPSEAVRLRTDPLAASEWARAFRRAALRIVTGSRTLLAAVQLGGPFLYFNGVAGRGSRRRRHRPEKILGLLALAGRGRWPADLLADLADFSRGRRITGIVERAARKDGGWSRFPRLPPPEGFAAGFEEAGPVLVRLARRWADDGGTSSHQVAELRRASQR